MLLRDEVLVKVCEQRRAEGPERRGGVGVRVEVGGGTQRRGGLGWNDINRVPTSTNLDALMIVEKKSTRTSRGVHRVSHVSATSCTTSGSPSFDAFRSIFRRRHRLRRSRAGSVVP